MFVMGGAVGVHALLARFILRRERPLFDDEFHVPAKKTIDGRLLAGAALFGVGWGLGGFCPGPALVSAASGALPAIVFVVAMTIGMLAQNVTLPKGDDAGARAGSAPPPP